MGCVLRAGGAEFAVGAFLAESPLRPDAVFHKGDPHAPGLAGAMRRLSGLSLSVSRAAEGDLDRQIQEAIAFLDEFEGELRRLGSFPGVEVMLLDFGVAWPGAAMPTATFPSELLWRAGALDISLQVSLEAPRRDDGER